MAVGEKVLMVAARWVMLLLLSDAGGRRRGRERRDKGEEAGGAAASGWLACARGPLTHHVAGPGNIWNIEHPTLSLAFSLLTSLALVTLLNPAV